MNVGHHYNRCLTPSFLASDCDRADRTRDLGVAVTWGGSNERDSSQSLDDSERGNLYGHCKACESDLVEEWRTGLSFEPGLYTGQWLVATIFEDMAAFGKAAAAMTSNAEMQQVQQDNAKLGAVMHDRWILLGLDL